MQVKIDILKVFNDSNPPLNLLGVLVSVYNILNMSSTL